MTGSLLQAGDTTASTWGDTPRISFPIHPRPVGIGTADVESLSGYIQRFADVNDLPVFCVLDLAGWVRRHVPTNPDVYPRDLAGLASISGQPIGVLEQLTVLPIYRVFHGRGPFNPLSVWQFFRSSGGSKRIFTRMRRYCCECLRETLVYRLLWQFCEVEACLRHGTLLTDRCGVCGRPSPILARTLVLGRCRYCRRELVAAENRVAPMKLLVAQRTVQRDYHLLLAGQISFAPPDSAVNGLEGFALRLERMLQNKNLSRSAFATRIGVAHNTIILWKARGRALPSFNRFLHLARPLAGSFEAFARIEPATRRSPSGRPRPRLRCMNPWCPSHRSSASTFSKGAYYGCRDCGCRFSRRRRTLYTLPLGQFFRALYETCQRLPARGDGWLTPFTTAGVSLRQRNFIRRRLVRAGIVAEKNGEWVYALSSSDRLNGYPMTPLLALQARRRQISWRSETPDQFVSRLRRAIGALTRRGQPITVAKLAEHLNMRRVTLSHRLRILAPRVKPMIAAARQESVARQHTASERQLLDALPGAVDQLVAQAMRPSFMRVCQRLGLTQWIKVRYPTLSSEIRRACRQASRRLMLQRRRHYETQIAKIVRMMRIQGLTPSYREVAAQLGTHFAGDDHLLNFFRKLRGFSAR